MPSIHLNGTENDRPELNDFRYLQKTSDTNRLNEKSAVDLVMIIDMIITTGRETGRFSEKPLVRTLRLSPHQANHGYLTRLLPGLFLPEEKSSAPPLLAPSGRMLTDPSCRERSPKSVCSSFPATSDPIHPPARSDPARSPARPWQRE